MVPTSTSVKVAVKSRISPKADAVAVFVSEGQKKPQFDGLGEDERKAVHRLIDGQVVRGRAREVASDLVEAGRNRLRRVYVVGLGTAEKLTPETVRQAGGALAKAARGDRIGNVAVVLPAGAAAWGGEATQALVEGFLLASFRYTEYAGKVKKQKEAEEQAPQAVVLTVVSDERNVKAAVQRGQIIADAQNFARTIASRPGNDINPVSLVKVAQQLAKEAGLSIRVIDDKQMQKLGMGGMLGVGGGSRTPPRIIVLEHRGQATKRRSDGATMGRTAAQAAPLLVVGKTITFDTGGISIKPAENMGKMIHDKCGGMAVLGLMYAVGKLKVSQRVVGILTCAENHVSAEAYRPGDILRMYNGVTVEVINTDAEGRLVLGDALAWGIEQYKPRGVVNLATLTGAMIIALGRTICGAMSNNDTIAGEVIAAAERAGEKIWRLPLFDEHREKVKSESADILNSAGRDASSITAGAFLSHFVPETTPWVHLDIAGVADTEKDLPYYGKGATGWGVRTLVEWVEH